MESSETTNFKTIEAEEFENKTKDLPNCDNMLDAAGKEECAGDESAKKKKRKRGKKKKKSTIQDPESNLKEARVVADTGKRIPLAVEVKQLRKENAELRRKLAELEIKSKRNATECGKISAVAIGDPFVRISPKTKSSAKIAHVPVNSVPGKSAKVVKSAGDQKKKTVQEFQDSAFKNQSCGGSLAEVPATVAGSSSGNTKQSSKKTKPVKAKKKTERNVYDFNIFEDGLCYADFFDAGITFMDDLMNWPQ